MLRIAIILFLSLSFFPTFAEKSLKSSKAKIHFLSKQVASKAIVDDHLEVYFDTLHPMEMSAKTGKAISGNSLQSMRDECRNRYQNNTMNFEPEEKQILEQQIQILHPILMKHYPKIGTLPWSFIKVNSSIEGGLPHTRDRHIIISDKMLSQFAKAMEKNSNPMFLLFIRELLVHEQVHVLQRLQQNLFDDLYLNQWGFIKAKSIESCSWLEKHHLSNPDGVSCNWVYPISRDKQKTYHLPLVVFSEGERLKKMPMDFRMIMLDLKQGENGHYQLKLNKSGIPKHQNLLRIPEYTSAFPLSKNIYHPNETSADLISKLVIFDHFLPEKLMPAQVKENMNKHHIPLREWCTKHLH